MNKGDLSGTPDKKIKDWEPGESIYTKSRTGKAYLGTLKIGQHGATYGGEGTKPAGAPVLAGGAKQQQGKPTGGPPPIPGGSKEKSILASMMGKACKANKGARLSPQPPTNKAAFEEQPDEESDSMKTAKSILDEMMEKAGPANDAQMRGPVSSASHGGLKPAQTSTGSPEHPNRGPAQMYVSEAAHAGSSPAQTSAPVNHPNRGPAQLCACVNAEGPGNDSQVNKAITAMSVPRLPRALAAASVEQWRNAPKVGTRINTVGDTSGPLHGELIDPVEGEVASPHNPVMKACSGCGRTYTLRKSDDGCPTCTNLHRGNMTKSRGGMLIPTTID